jgi:hypothetical protein
MVSNKFQTKIQQHQLNEKNIETKKCLIENNSFFSKPLDLIRSLI